MGYIEAVQRARDPSVFVVLLEDSAAMLGLLVAFIGIALTQYTNILYIDGIASIIIGLILVGTAVWLAYETKGLLIGESANRWEVKGLRDILQISPVIDKVNEVLTMHMGPDFSLATISVDFNKNLTTGELENGIAVFNPANKQELLQVKRIFIEAEKFKSTTVKTE